MADEQTDTPDPAVTRVLDALTDRLHESLCNCRKYPDECASRDDYRRDDLVHTFGHAEEALEEALKQGWTPPNSAQTAALWATRPGWTRAHAVVHAGSMFGEQSWLTQCQRDYPLDDPLTDEPTPAPTDMPHCAHCTEVLAGKRT